MAHFSSRRAQITKTTLALAEQYEKERAHAPDQRAFASMRPFANAMTRRTKEPGALDFTRLLREWESTSCDAALGTLRDLARTIWRDPRSEYGHTRRARADARPWPAGEHDGIGRRGNMISQMCSDIGQDDGRDRHDAAARAGLGWPRLGPLRSP